MAKLYDFAHASQQVSQGETIQALICPQNVQAPERVAGAQDALSLEAISGPCEGTVYTKAGDVLTVGRTRASKLHIKDPAVSERHAEVRWETDRWTVTDVGSSNGTTVNGETLIEGVCTCAAARQGSDTLLRLLFFTERPEAIEGTLVHYRTMSMRKMHAGRGDVASTQGQLSLAGLPRMLKDGDIILFGSDSQLRVQITPASDDSTTVEQHLRAECKQWTQRLQVPNPGWANGLWILHWAVAVVPYQECIGCAGCRDGRSSMQMIC